MLSASHVRPLLLLEINEVPWRVIDMVLAGASCPNVQAFFSASRTFTTLTRDEGELSPWITWPTLHRGLPNTEHGIATLGQDVASFRGTPIWQEYRRRGLSIGVCGSMQSWPPIEPGEGGFYLPDTFAHDERCIPSYLEPLQRFNLGLVRKNGLVVRDDGLVSAELLSLAPSLLRAKIRPSTWAKIAEQLVAERVDKARLARRPIFQSLLFWDVFRGLYDPARPPAFATFFTNHVAGVMHRYWDQIFPEDFGSPPGPRPQRETMGFALEVLDQIVGEAMAMRAACPELLIVLATSMGQAAVHRQHEGYSAAVTDVDRLLSLMGASAGQYRPLLAMVPQVAAEIDDAAVRARVIEAIEGATTASGQPLLSAHEAGKSVSITIATPGKADIDAGGLRLRGGGELVPWARAGVTMHQVPPGTAYHIPEGVMAAWGEGVEASDARTPMAATEVKAYLMKLAGLGRAEPARAGAASSTLEARG